MSSKVDFLYLKLPLFDGILLFLAPIDHEKDAEIESRWTHDAVDMRLLSFEPAKPLSPAQVKKSYEAIEKSVDGDKNLFYFTIRLRSDGRLLGFLRLYDVIWTHGAGTLRLGIGDPADRRHGYGSEALSLGLRYAVEELNLYRLSAWIAEYNTPALRFFEKAGFTVEVCRRQAINRSGRRWDLISMGMLREEWERSLGIGS